MNSKIVAGASILAIVAVLATAQPASAQNWACGGGCYPGYAFAPGYGYYGAYDSIPWNYRGGPHPR